MIMNVAVIEDNKAESELILRYLNEFQKDHEVVIRANVFEDALSFLDKYRSEYDLVLMDIDLPMINGMAAARKLRSLDTVVTLVFITNLSQFAIEGYAVNALDYIVKPVSRYNFFSLLKKCMRLKSQKKDKMLTIHTQNGIARLNEKDIYYIETINHKIIFHTGSDNVEMWGSLRQIESMISDLFARCNSCYLINLQFVTAVRGNMVFVGENALTISRGKKQEFIDALTNFLASH
jgi:two-component system, LytTR family, response regulator LytT